MIIIGGGMLLLGWLLTRQDTIVNAGLNLQAVPGPVQLQQSTATCSPEECPAPSSSTVQNPTLPSLPDGYLETLSTYTKRIEASNLNGTWETSWRIAAERDSWIASQGFMPTQWEGLL